MGAIFSAIVGAISSVITSVVAAVISSSIPVVTQQLVVKVLTVAVVLIVAAAVLQVIGKFLGLEKVTDSVAKVFYTIAIVLIAVAAFIAQSIALALIFLGAAFLFLYLVDTVFGTHATDTFVSAVVDTIGAIADAVSAVITGAMDVLGTALKATGLTALLGNWLFWAIGGFVVYKVVTASKQQSTTEKEGNYGDRIIEEQRLDVRSWRA